MTTDQLRKDATSTLWFLAGRLTLDGALRHIPVLESPFSVGRNPRASLPIANSAISNYHAEIIDAESGLVIRDNGSTNGTFVNGQRIVGTASIEDGDIIQFGDIVFRLGREDVEAAEGTAKTDAYDQALALAQFDKLMSENTIVPHYQPIVDLRDAQPTVIAYEVLGRSKVFGLETADKMFRAAGRLNLEKELSSMLRWKGVETSLSFAKVPHLFVNTHRSELNAELADSLRRLRELNGTQPLTLEIHAAAASSIDGIRAFKSILTDLDITLAFDDFGAGRDRLLELAECPPDYLKFDMSLVRGIDTATHDQLMVIESLVSLAGEMNVVSIAVGVETAEEADACKAVGFELAQGYLFGKPSPIRNTREIA